MQVQTRSNGREPLAAYFLFLSTDCCSSATADPDKWDKVGGNWQMQAERLLPARLVLSPDNAQRVFLCFSFLHFFNYSQRGRCFSVLSLFFVCFILKCVSQYRGDKAAQWLTLHCDEVLGSAPVLPVSLWFYSSFLANSKNIRE